MHASARDGVALSVRPNGGSRRRAFAPAVGTCIPVDAVQPRPRSANARRRVARAGQDRITAMCKWPHRYAARAPWACHGGTGTVGVCGRARAQHATHGSGIRVGAADGPRGVARRPDITAQTRIPACGASGRGNRCPPARPPRRDAAMIHKPLAMRMHCSGRVAALDGLRAGLRPYLQVAPASDVVNTRPSIVVTTAVRASRASILAMSTCSGNATRLQRRPSTVSRMAPPRPTSQQTRRDGDTPPVNGTTPVATRSHLVPPSAV